MTFKPTNDTKSKRSSRSVRKFQGSHYGVGRTDQRAGLAYVVDFDFMKDRMQLRSGKRKNSEHGYNDSIDGVVDISMMQRELMGVIVDGTMAIYTIEDVLAGRGRYYTWQEVKDNFTWGELRGKTWDELRKRDGLP